MNLQSYLLTETASAFRALGDIINISSSQLLAVANRCIVRTRDPALTRRYSLGHLWFQLARPIFQRGCALRRQGTQEWIRRVQTRPTPELIAIPEDVFPSIEIACRADIDEGTDLLRRLLVVVVRCTDELLGFGGKDQHQHTEHVLWSPVFDIWSEMMIWRAKIVEFVDAWNWKENERILKSVAATIHSSKIRKHRVLLGKVLMLLGSLYLRKADYRESMQAFLEASALFGNLGLLLQQTEARLRELDGLNYLGLYSDFLDRFDALKTRWNKMKQTYRFADDPKAVERIEMVFQQVKASHDQERGVTGCKDHYLHVMMSKMGISDSQDPVLGDHPKRKNLVARFCAKFPDGTKQSEDMKKYYLEQSRRYDCITKTHTMSGSLMYLPQSLCVVGSMYMMSDPKKQLSFYLRALKLFRQRWNYLANEPEACVFMTEKIQFIADMCVALIYQFQNDSDAHKNGWTAHLALDLCDIRNSASQVLSLSGPDLLESCVDLPEDGTYLVLHLSKDCALHLDRIWRWVIRNGRIVLWDFRETSESTMRELLRHYKQKCVVERATRGLFEFDESTECYVSVDRGETDEEMNEDEDEGEAEAAKEESLDEVGTRIFRLLLDGLVPYLPEDPEENIVIIPDRCLLLTPFACLPSSRDDDGLMRYFVEEHTFSISTSLRMSHVNRIQKQLCDRFRSKIDSERRLIRAVVVGDVVCCSECWLRFKRRCSLHGHHSVALSHSRREIRSFAESMCVPRDDGCDNSVVVLCRESALPGMMKECCETLHPRFVSVSAHGSNKEVEAQFGGSQDLAPKGLIKLHSGHDLPASELALWDLKGVDLVHLNICLGAEGLLSPEGVAGFHTAVFSAGCPSCICACWKVGDLWGSIIGRYWSDLISRNQNLTKAQSLRHALLAAKVLWMEDRNERSDGNRAREFPVSVWAGLQLYGDPV